MGGKIRGLDERVEDRESAAQEIEVRRPEMGNEMKSRGLEKKDKRAVKKKALVETPTPRKKLQRKAKLTFRDSGLGLSPNSSPKKKVPPWI